MSVDDASAGLSLAILGLVSTDGLSKETVTSLNKNLLSCKLRQQRHRSSANKHVQWHLEVSPLNADCDASDVSSVR